MPSAENKIFFSILVPIYNAERYIEACICSVLAQTYFEFELILVDDGSNDRSGVICDEYSDKDPRIRAFHKKNSGSMHTRMYALEHCVGDYVIFLDSDDSLHKNALETIWNKISETQSDCIIYGYRTIDTEGNCLYKTAQDAEWCVTDKNPLYKKVLQESSYNAMWRKAVKRELFRRFDYSEYYHISMGEDLLQSLEIYKYARKVLFIPDCLYDYRVNPNSVTHSIDYTRKEPDFTVEEQTLKFLRSENVFSQNDFEEYYSYCQRSICNLIYKICRSEADKDAKKRAILKMVDKEYCRFMIVQKAKLLYLGIKCYVIVGLVRRNKVSDLIKLLGL